MYRKQICGLFGNVLYLVFFFSFDPYTVGYMVTKTLDFIESAPKVIPMEFKQQNKTL